MTVILVGMLELSRLRILRVHDFLLGTLSVQISETVVYKAYVNAYHTMKFPGQSGQEMALLLYT